jgi:4'-phosphopantetheinyl transferase EntD
VIEDFLGIANVVFGAIADHQHALLSTEEPLAKDATEARMRELRAGRSAARTALRRVGVLEAPILADTRGQPIWPPGVCGSLSHTHTHVAAVVARVEVCQAVGIDVDDQRPFDRASRIRLLSKTEERALTEASNASSRDAANIAFCAKEAFFKAHFAVFGDPNLEYLDVALSRGPDATSLRPVPVAPSSPEAHFFYRTTIYIRTCDHQLVCIALTRKL